MSPTITGTGPKTVAVGSPLTLTATATDDGLPKPKKRKPQAAAAPKAEAFNPIPSLIPEGMMRGPGLGIKWIVYRGPGKVIIDAP